MAKAHDPVAFSQIHRNDNTTPLEETLEALHDLVKAGKVRYLGASSMHTWEFGKALHLQREHGWARFVSMQDHYNLLAREEKREMLPLCRDEGVGTVVWGPLARGRLARPWDEARGTQRSAEDGFADMLYTPATERSDQAQRPSAATERSDRAIVDAVGIIAEHRGASRAQIALAWLRTNPVVVAPLVGASRTSHIDDAVSSLDVELTGEEIDQLERPYTARSDFQGVSDDAELQRIMSALPNFSAADATRDHEGELSEHAT